MQVTVTFRHTDPTPALKAYAEEKIRKVERFLHSPQEAHVVLSVEKIRHIAEVQILADGLTITGKEETADLYSAIDQVMDKIEQQLKKQKGRRQTRKSSESIRTRENIRASGEASPAPKKPSVSENNSQRIVRSDNFLPKPMSVDDAVLELIDRADGVVVFRNASNMKICVLHRMKNGSIGLIEPPAE